MTRLATVLPLCFLALACNIEFKSGESADSEVSRLTDPGPERERAQALEFAGRFLEMLDGDEDAYPLASRFLHDAVSKGAWDATIAGVRGLAGEFEARETRAYGYTEELPDAPPGRYFVIEFDTRFSKGTALETVVVGFDDTGYELAGYHLAKKWTLRDLF